MATSKTKQSKRLKIWNKYGGRCAYCGAPLDLSEMTIDHIVPIRRNSDDAECERMGVTHGSLGIDNLNPSCKPCNTRKSTLSLELFREELEATHERMMRDNANYRQMMRFGQIKLVNNGKIEFYFEKYIREKREANERTIQEQELLAEILFGSNGLTNRI